MTLISKVADIVQIARELHKQPVRVACASPEDSDSLEALRMAADEGIAAPIAVGRRQAIVTLANTLGISLDGFEFVDVVEPEDSAPRAARLVAEGEAACLMKGSLPTKAVIRAVLDQRSGLRSGKILSHCSLFDCPQLNKPVIITDPAVNIKPSFSQKIEIVKNAAEVMRKLGVKRPKVAMLAAVERVELPAMPATLDAKLMERMAEAGLLGEVVVQGPLALDDAVSPDVVRAKDLTGPVVGDADILVVPEIETGNVFYKALTCFGGLDPAGMIWGAKVPIIVPSRADTARTKFLGMAFAAAMSEP